MADSGAPRAPDDAPAQSSAMSSAVASLLARSKELCRVHMGEDGADEGRGEPRQMVAPVAESPVARTDGFGRSPFGATTPLPRAIGIALPPFAALAQVPAGFRPSPGPSMVSPPSGHGQSPVVDLLQRAQGIGPSPPPLPTPRANAVDLHEWIQESMKKHGLESIVLGSDDAPLDARGSGMLLSQDGNTLIEKRCVRECIVQPDARTTRDGGNLDDLLALGDHEPFALLAPRREHRFCDAGNSGASGASRQLRWPAPA
jgi:hypothetical protein